MATGTINCSSYSSGAWTASESSSTGTQLTDKIPVKKGVNIINAHFPVIASTGNYVVSIKCDTGSVTSHFLTPSPGGNDTRTLIANFGTDTNIWVSSSSNSSTTFTYLERGGISAVRVI